ncbi:MAG: 30S ribosomal protein S6 [Phycisphaerae bacterium]|nr:30S ribosomal protein S6 [Phycisphaerae bacterium]
MKRYEAMFLFDNAVTRDWADIEREVRRLCDRIGAELLVCVKFDERKLAYEIKRRKRGTYVLTYLEAPSERIDDLERDARLSESILRLLVLRADGLTEVRLAELKAHTPETALAPAGDGRRYDDDRYGRGRERGVVERSPIPAEKAAKAATPTKADVEKPAPAEAEAEKPAPAVADAEEPVPAEVPAEVAAPAEVSLEVGSPAEAPMPSAEPTAIAEVPASSAEPAPEDEPTDAPREE